MKATRSKIGNRRSHRRVAKPTLTPGAQAGTLRRRHFADPKTGLYRGKPVAASPVSSDSKNKKKKSSGKKKTSTDTHHSHTDTA